MLPRTKDRRTAWSPLSRAEGAGHAPPPGGRPQPGWRQQAAASREGICTATVINQPHLFTCTPSIHLKWSRNINPTKKACLQTARYPPPGDGGDNRPRPWRPACRRWTGDPHRPETRSFTCTNITPVFTEKLYSHDKSEINIKNRYVFPSAKCNIALLTAPFDGSSLGRPAVSPDNLAAA